MNEFWDVLEIDGDMDEAQILFAHIKDYSLGSIEEDEKIKVYTTKNSKNKINVLINNLNFNNNLHLSWDTIKNENWHLMWKKYLENKFGAEMLEKSKTILEYSLIFFII